MRHPNTSARMVLEKAKEADGTSPYWAVIRPVVTEEPGLPPVPAVMRYFSSLLGQFRSLVESQGFTTD